MWDKRAKILLLNVYSCALIEGKMVGPNCMGIEWKVPDSSSSRASQSQIHGQNAVCESLRR